MLDIYIVFKYILFTIGFRFIAYLAESGIFYLLAVEVSKAMAG